MRSIASVQARSISWPGASGCFARCSSAARMPKAPNTPGDRVADRVARVHRRVARRARDVGEARVGLEQAREAGVARVGAGLAEAGHAQDHQLRLRLPQRLLVQPPAVERARAVVLDQHVELRQQAQEQRLALGLAQVERDRALVAVHRLPEQRLAVLVRRQRAQRIAALAIRAQGSSTFSTSAPKSPSSAAAKGPAMTLEISRTFRPSRGPLMRSRGLCLSERRSPSRKSPSPSVPARRLRPARAAVGGSRPACAKSAARARAGRPCPHA